MSSKRPTFYSRTNNFFRPLPCTNSPSVITTKFRNHISEPSCTVTAPLAFTNWDSFPPQFFTAIWPSRAMSNTPKGTLVKSIVSSSCQSTHSFLPHCSNWKILSLKNNLSATTKSSPITWQTMSGFTTGLKYFLTELFRPNKKPIPKIKLKN